MDKLIPVSLRAIASPLKMSLLPAEIEYTPAVTIKPSLTLVTDTDNLSRKKT